MADVTGPIPTLAGALHIVPKDMKCDDHPDRPAYRRVQGETDSMGAELHDLCEQCFNEHKAAVAAHAEEAATGCCDWCKSHATTLRDHRDFEEGSSGPVYQVCRPCRDKESAACQAELDENERDDDHRYYSDFCDDD